MNDSPFAVWFEVDIRCPQCKEKCMMMVMYEVSYIVLCPDCYPAIIEHGEMGVRFEGINRDWPKKEELERRWDNDRRK